MIDRLALLSDLQSLLKSLEADLLARTDSDEVPEVGEWLRSEYQKAQEAERTAHSYKQWLDDFITQVAAAWVLSCVFARFLEDNELVDPPRIAGPGSRLDRARDEHTLFFQDPERAKLTNREYLLDIFDGLAQTAAGKELFGQHNPMNSQPKWLGPDAAGELLRFFQKIDSDSGLLVHDFTDPDWDTRFLGDLYQDLSEAARKKYALLQTPDFVEEFILDRTLEPALDEFGLQPETSENNLFKMIDPACGSGHFLLGSFPRILGRWQKEEPGTNIRVLVQRTLDSIHGVDINPFAIAIARFRLLLAALAASGVKRLADAPSFAMNLACGDSLYHGKERQLMLDGVESDESHYFRTENASDLRRTLQEGTFHAVVANPPYITPKDRSARNVYKRYYPSCYMKYSLSVPFMERIFNLAVWGNGCMPSGFVGQITSNSFMKREFGKKLVGEFFPTVELTHVIDTAGAYVPGHGTPTVLLFGRNRKPARQYVRAVLGIQGEPDVPDDPAKGVVWRAIIDLVDKVGMQSNYVTVADLDRETFTKHPWSLSGGGAAELKACIELACTCDLDTVADSIGITCFTLEDDIFLLPQVAARRHRIESSYLRTMIVGDVVSDWSRGECDATVFPYDSDYHPIGESHQTICLRYLWLAKTSLANNKLFGGKTKVECGLKWFEFGRLTSSKLMTPLSIAFANVATHNHFLLDRGGNIFKDTSPLIKLRSDTTEDEHLSALGLLNSSTACFWMKQVLQNKGSTVDNRGARQRTDPFEDFYQTSAGAMKKFPMPDNCPSERASRIDRTSRQKSDSYLRLLNSLNTANTTATIGALETSYLSLHQKCIRLQEDLDWECYRLYGLLEDDLAYRSEESLGIQLGERAFEIVLARKIARGEVQATWFERHGSTPITELPDHWPDDYKQIVQRRIDVIESNPQIALIEQPEYKRRWNTTPWEEQVEKALKSWLLDRLESYFDFDGRMNDEGKANAQMDISLISVAKLADIARQDAQFMEVAEVYRDDPAFDVQKLVEELVKGEHVPLLPVLRYKPNGIRNRAEWEKTWELQRLEDKLRAGEDVRLSDYELTDQQRDDIAGWQQTTPENQRADDRALDAILSIPIPPKYKSSDFISTGGARYWALRGKLDVPKERWVSFPHCEGPDGTMMIAWAGYDHLQLARAISAYYVDVQQRLGGADDPRLMPLLAGVIELLPWLKQWHHEMDPEYNERMDEYFEGFVAEEAKDLGKTIDEIRDWQPPKQNGGRKRRAKQ